MKLEIMRVIEGFVDSAECLENELHIRLVVGGFDPAPVNDPVLDVVLANVEEPEKVLDALRQMQAEDGVHFEQRSATEAFLCSDHGVELVVRGTSMLCRGSAYGAQDYQRIAVQNHQWRLDLDATLAAALDKCNGVRSQVHAQLARLQAKGAGHAVGTTAHTLYRQHAEFLERLLATLGS